ncbi:MAG: hypothetical protein LBG76_06950 [Treponema sp.]|jgi:hypothetical protein|nr:hypothetical protein [Treponema sp.]
MKYPLFIITITALAVFFSGCSAQIEGSLRQNGSADLQVEAALEPRMTALIRRFQAMSAPETAAEALILDGSAMAQSMAAAPGIGEVSFRNTAPAAIAGRMVISKVDAFLAGPSQAGKIPFISYNPGGSGGGGKLRLFLDRQSAPQALTLFSADLSGYLSALMAPAVTGLALSKDEYLTQLSMIYGRPLADEIAAARINAAIDFPAPITSIQGGTAQGARARFSIPLLDILTLETPFICEVQW